MGSGTLVAAYILLPLAGVLWTLCATLVLVAFGTGLNWPSLTSLASQYAEIDVQGAVLGVMQSLSSLGRMLGAAWAGWVFGAFTPATPFFVSAGIMSLAAALAALFMIRAPVPPAEAPEPEPVTGAAV